MPISAPLPETIYLKCNACGRSGRYSRERYIELTGTDDAVPALTIFAKQIAKCPRALGIDPLIEERCRLIHDLEAEGRPYIPTP